MLKEKVAVITGASRGIGKEIALTFAREGATVIVNYNGSKGAAEEVVNTIINEDRKAEAYQCDIADFQKTAEMMDYIIKKYKRIDILVNNAGIAGIELFQNMSYENYHHIIETNLLSTMNCSHLAIPSMIQAHSGKIINISSIWGNVGASCEVAYSASKGGINSFTKALGKELAPSNIQVNAIACGVIETQMNHCLSSEEKQALTQEIPAGRFGTPLEVAELVFQLANNHSYLNGQVLTLDGAWT